MKTVLIALGGNAILQANQTATYETQLQNIRMCCTIISNIVNKGYRVILTHGNGPQVGHILLQNEMAKDSVSCCRCMYAAPRARALSVI